MYFPPTEILKIANFPTLGPKGPQKPPKFTYNPKCWQHKSNKICTFPQQKSSKLQSFMSSHFHFHNDRKLSSERTGLPPVWIWHRHPHPLIYVGGIKIQFIEIGKQIFKQFNPAYLIIFLLISNSCSGAVWGWLLQTPRFLVEYPLWKWGSSEKLCES